MTLTKDHLVKSVQESAELSKTISTDALQSLFEIIKKTLENGESVMICVFRPIPSTYSGLIRPLPIELIGVIVALDYTSRYGYPPSKST